MISETLGHDGGRRLTVYVPHDPAIAFVFVADGSWHTETLAQRLEDAAARPTMIVVVDGLPDDDGRAMEYVVGFDAPRIEAHERSFVEEVRGWVTSQYGAQPTPEPTAVWGASMGAEFALAVGLRHPDVHGVVFAASPGTGFHPPEPLPDRLPRAYLLAGSQEPFFLDNAERWARALREAKADSVLREREGDHGGVFWVEEFPLMVAWAFGGSARR